MDAADVVGDLVGRQELELEHVQVREHRTLELHAAAGAGHRVEEHRHLVVDPGCARVAHDQATEQAAVDVRLDVAHVVVEGPGTDHLLGDVEHIGPGLAGQDLVAAPAVLGGHTARPGAIGVDAVAQAVHMQAVAVMGVGVAHVDAQPLAGLCPDDRAGHAAVPRRLGSVRRHQRRGVGHGVVGVQVLAVDQRIDARFEDFFGRDSAEFMTFVELAVAAVAPRAKQGRQGAVISERFDPQEDVATGARCHGCPLPWLVLRMHWRPMTRARPSPGCRGLPALPPRLQQHPLTHRLDHLEHHLEPERIPVVRIGHAIRRHAVAEVGGAGQLVGVLRRAEVAQPPVQRRAGPATGDRRLHPPQARSRATAPRPRACFAWRWCKAS